MLVVAGFFLLSIGVVNVMETRLAWKPFQRDSMRIVSKGACQSNPKALQRERKRERVRERERERERVEP